MRERTAVKVSKRHQITLPGSVCQRLGIEPGDELLVDVQDGVVIMIPRPQSHAQAMAGLHREIWRGVDTDAYLRQEREEW